MAQEDEELQRLNQQMFDQGKHLAKGVTKFGADTINRALEIAGTQTFGRLGEFIREKYGEKPYKVYKWLFKKPAQFFARTVQVLTFQTPRDYHDQKFRRHQNHRDKQHNSKNMSSDQNNLQRENDLRRNNSARPQFTITQNSQESKINQIMANPDSPPLVPGKEEIGDQQNNKRKFSSVIYNDAWNKVGKPIVNFGKKTLEYIRNMSNNRLRK